MSKRILDEARSAYAAWKETQQGSYLERVIADGIVRDLVPALIHIAERQPLTTGFAHVDLSAGEEVVVPDEPPAPAIGNARGETYRSTGRPHALPY